MRGGRSIYKNSFTFFWVSNKFQRQLHIAAIALPTNKLWDEEEAFYKNFVFTNFYIFLGEP